MLLRTFLNLIKDYSMLKRQEADDIPQKQLYAQTTQMI